MKFKSFFILANLIVLCAWPSILRASGLESIAKKLSVAAKKMNHAQIAVPPFPYHDGKESVGSTVVAERLITLLLKQKKLIVVERSLLDKVIHEMKLQHTGLISQETAKELGHILGVEAVVTGTLINMEESNLEVNARIIQTESGLVLAAASEIIKRTWQEAPSLSYPPQPLVPATNSDVQSPAPDNKNKMSAFFHTREYVQEEKKPDIAPPLPTRKESAGLRMTNSGDFMSKNVNERSLLDAPESLLREIQTSPEESESQEFMLIKRSWEAHIPKNEFAQGASVFDMLSRDFTNARKLRYAALAKVYWAESCYLKADYDQAIQIARDLARNNDFPRLQGYGLYIIARSQEELGRFKVATAIYRQIVQNYPFEPKLIRAAGHRAAYRSRKY